MSDAERLATADSACKSTGSWRQWYMLIKVIFRQVRESEQWLIQPNPSTYLLSAMDEAIKILKSQRILVFKPGGTKKEEEEYERSVATPNLLHRFSRPDCVIQPENASHVQAIIKGARSKKLKVTIKCAGHSYAGHSTAFQGISLDRRRMKNVRLDLKSRTVTMDAGCQWGDVYKTLINDRRNGKGFIINGGRCPPVGVSGFIMGGEVLAIHQKLRNG